MAYLWDVSTFPRGSHRHKHFERKREDIIDLPPVMEQPLQVHEDDRGVQYFDIFPVDLGSVNTPPSVLTRSRLTIETGSRMIV